MVQAADVPDDTLEATNISHIGDSDYSDNACEWFIALPDRVKGPFSANKIRQMFEDCEIDGLTSVWRKDTNDWIPLGKDKILKAHIGRIEIQDEDIDNKDPDENDHLKFDKFKSDEKNYHVTDGSEPAGNGVEIVGNDILSKICTMDSPLCNNDATTREMIKKIDTEENEAKVIEKFKKQKYLKRKRERIERGEFIASKKNYSVYITGLPKDVTSDELQSVFRKAGVIKIDPITTLPKVKIYRDECDVPKGDATITFLNRESVSLCLKYFDDYYFRPNVKIHVEEAQFKANMDKKRPYIDPKLRKKKFLAAKYEAQRISSWKDEMDDGTGRRVVIAKPMFSLEQAKKYTKGDEFYEKLRHEVYEEVIKFAEVDKITPMSRHPQGIVCLKFKTAKDAEIFIAAFKDRLFDGNKLDVYFYDGKTDLAAQCLPEPDVKDNNMSDSGSDSDYYYNKYEENSNYYEDNEDKNNTSDRSFGDEECSNTRVERFDKMSNKTASNDIDDYLNKLID